MGKIYKKKQANLTFCNTLEMFSKIVSFVIITGDFWVLVHIFKINKIRNKWDRDLNEYDRYKICTKHHLDQFWTSKKYTQIADPYLNQKNVGVIHILEQTWENVRNANLANSNFDPNCGNFGS